MDIQSIIRVFLNSQPTEVYRDFQCKVHFDNALENGVETASIEKRNSKKNILLKEEVGGRFSKVEDDSRQHTPSIDFIGELTIRHSSPLSVYLGGYLKSEQENVG